MSGKISNFGGKKAAPFQKGGKRRAKVLAAKAAIRKSRRAKAKADLAHEAPMVDLSKLSTAQRKALPSSAFVFPSKRQYPIHDKGHAAFALAVSKGKPEHGAVVAAVRKRYPNMGKKG